LGEYEGLLREIIHAFKYDGRRSVGAGLSRIMGRQAADLLDGAQFVVPVPLHRSRQRERGFNQSEILARDFEVPVCRSLRRTRATRPQVNLTAHERYLNVADAFTMPPRAAAELSGKVVVLVDDVTTTGATLDACAQVLLAAGVREVRAITAARVATGPR
jgi:ComF family protein